ncbi:hypothetical protein HNP84_004988 [Thermocatellispora tengchongensis]|uniref:DUF4132 domain-containing protein n=1 Tax=Thermocatellispora tengchongensis TaxID=1073253 RepID=A0A840P7G6_9ACTN|nr:DUF4132 domain-containing protein [Thermocatellispora tengchongensis]MBB5135252.1 hypothetical protein [Thermocatellispora tengchongensis]
MGVLDALPAEHRGWLGELDAATLEAFARLDAAYTFSGSAWPAHQFADTPVGRLTAQWNDAGWRAMALWTQMRLHMVWSQVDGPERYCWTLGAFPRAIARRALTWSARELDLLWRITLALPDPDQHFEDLYRIPVAATRLLPMAERAPLLPHLRQVHHTLEEQSGLTDRWDVKHALDTLLVDQLAVCDPAAAARVLVPLRDGFARLIHDEYAGRLGAPSALPLARRWSTATSANPSDHWREEAARRATPEAVALAREILGRLPAYREQVVRHRHHERERTVVTYLHKRTGVLLRGMIWTCDSLTEPWVTPLLGDIAVAAGTGIGGAGANARSEMVANAAIGVLARRGGPEVIAQMARVQAKVRKKSVLAAVARALDDVAAQTGLSPERLLDRTVPDFGLGPDGTRTEHGLRLSVEGGISYVDPSGEVRKSIPTAVRREHAGLLAELKATAKELRKTLPAERFRIERALATERIWRWSEVCEFFLDHPVTGAFARNLIWEILQGPAGLAVLRDGGWELTDPAGRRIQPYPRTPVRLWHPIDKPVEEVRAWRDHLLGLGLRQPFKQAFREVYVLTPAEERAYDRSRRFSGHLLRYGQAKALLTERGWTGMSLGHWGPEYGSGEAEAVKEWPGGLSACWDFDLDPDSAPGDGFGTASICLSGVLRFVSPRGEVVPLAEVPPLTLSEALRDADLAVGVTSTGLDPHGHGEYWQSYGFGELTESGQIRRDALARLLPRLAIAGRCTLLDRFLRVRGDLRTYRIHLGSGNILMEPNDAYLCIVPQGDGDRVFLPFEEDGGMLSVILSKAFLLAADAEITDPSITRQIRP